MEQVTLGEPYASELVEKMRTLSAVKAAIGNLYLLADIVGPTQASRVMVYSSGDLAVFYGYPQPGQAREEALRLAAGVVVHKEVNRWADSGPVTEYVVRLKDHPIRIVFRDTELAATCHVVYEEVEIPASKKLVAKVVCDDDDP